MPVHDADIDWADIPEQPWPKLTDRVFVEVQPFRGAWAARQTDERLYRMIKGFHDAGDLLAAAGLADLHRAQNLLYPVIFNYRQGIELQLKYFLMAYGPLAGEAPNFHSHKLIGLWAACRSVFCRLESKEHPTERTSLDAAEVQLRNSTASILAHMRSGFHTTRKAVPSN
jgi:hypothetical protein